MNKFPLVLISLMLLLNACNNEEKVEPDSGYQVVFYEPDNAAFSTHSIQTTIVKDDSQLTTFGNFDSKGNPITISEAYFYSKHTNEETVILLDKKRNPAYLYSVDLSSGTKMASLTEFVNVDENSFLVRIYHYDWESRIGTLLSESSVSKSSGRYATTKVFEVDDMSQPAGASSRTDTKVNSSFASPVSRIDLEIQQDENAPIDRGSSLGPWTYTFNQFKNNNITKWIIQTHSSGDGMEGTGIEVSSSTTSNARGVAISQAGKGIGNASVVLNTIFTNSFASLTNSIKEKFPAIKNGAWRSENNVVERTIGNSATLTHWLNSNMTFESVEELMQSIRENETLINPFNINDLPDQNGLLQISLSWDTNRTDLDLLVEDPFGEVVSYGHPVAQSGGYMDRDDTDGFGPENINWSGDIPNGEYRVYVYYFGCSDTICPATNYKITVSNGLGDTTEFEGEVLINGERRFVASFTLSGTEIL